MAAVGMGGSGENATAGAQVHTRVLVAYVADRPGVLTKIASIFYRRGMNIRTLTVGRTTEEHIKKIVFRVDGSDDALMRLMLQVDNLVDCLAVDIQPDTARNARELCLARVAFPIEQEGQAKSDTDVAGSSRQALEALAADFNAATVSQDETSAVLQVVGAPEEIERFITALEQGYELVDLSRTGATAMPRHEPTPHHAAERKTVDYVRTLVTRLSHHEGIAPAE